MISIPGSSSVWRAPLQSLQRDFRQAAKKHANLRHVIVQALDQKQTMPPSLETEMRVAGGWSVGEMRGRWEVPVGQEASASYMDWLRWNSPAKLGYLFGDPAARQRFEHMAERAWLALPGSRDGKNQAYPQPRPLERWMAFVYLQLNQAASSYLLADDELWVTDHAEDGQRIERRFFPRAVKQGDIVSTGYPDAEGLSDRARRWVYTALATDPFTASAVAIDLLIADPDPAGPFLISWEEMDAYQKSPAFQNANFLVEMIILANGKQFPVYRRDCMAVLGAKPSICPSAEPKPPVRLRPDGEMMAGLESRFRELRLVGDGETIHSVGRQTTVDTTCVCHLSNPLPDPARLAACQSEKPMTGTNYDQLCVRLLDILTGDILSLPSWNDLQRHEQQIVIAVSEVTGITPEYWEKLDCPAREPWLENTIRLLTKEQSPDAREDGPRVVLRAVGEGPIVGGVEKSPLTLPQYDVVKALLEAGERGLSKDGLDRKSNRGDARKILKRLAESDPDWKAVIHFPGKAGGGYRIR